MLRLKSGPKSPYQERCEDMTISSICRATETLDGLTDYEAEHNRRWREALSDGVLTGEEIAGLVYLPKRHFPGLRAKLGAIVTLARRINGEFYPQKDALSEAAGKAQDRVTEEAA